MCENSVFFYIDNPRYCKTSPSINNNAYNQQIASTFALAKSGCKNTT